MARLLTAELGPNVARAAHLVQIFWGRDRDVFRRADRTQEMARLLTAELGANFARAAHLDASFLGEGFGGQSTENGASVDRRIGVILARAAHL